MLRPLMPISMRQTKYYISKKKELLPYSNWNLAHLMYKDTALK